MKLYKGCLFLQRIYQQTYHLNLVYNLVEYRVIQNSSDHMMSEYEYLRTLMCTGLKADIHEQNLRQAIRLRDADILKKAISKAAENGFTASGSKVLRAATKLLAQLTLKKGLLELTFTPHSIKLCFVSDWNIS